MISVRMMMETRTLQEAFVLDTTAGRMYCRRVLARYE